MKDVKLENLQFNENDIKYLKLLSYNYPNLDSATTEIIKLKAILNLPKGTEHFLSDIHGASEAFQHVLKNASGVIKRKIERLFKTTLTKKERQDLAILIYYPKEKLELILPTLSDIDEWYEVTLYRLIRLAKDVASKYTRLKVRESFPKELAYIIDELLNEQDYDKKLYYEKIIQTIVKMGNAKKYIVALSDIIKKLVIDKLHILGDIFDRGPGAHIIMDTLINYHSVDIQWGNHDILWMGAAAGSEACIANVIRISLRYANLKTLEEGYGINLRPLATFASEIYKKGTCKNFIPKFTEDEKFSEKEKDLMARMHKAISIIQFKVEGQLIKSRPKFDMDDRLLLDKINYENGTIVIDGKTYKLNDTFFPTVNPNDPYSLTNEEQEVIDKLKSSFIKSEKLQKHIKFLFSKGTLYLAVNNNLLFHGCILLNDDSSFKKLQIQGKEYTGKALMDKFDQIARQGYFAKDKERKKYGMDIMWYLWEGADSPLFGKTKQATFERYFIDDKETHKEEKNPYYKYRDDENTCKKILKEFGLNPENSHIINGHVPVKAKKGESPVKANGKLIVIDGGFSKAYQKVTGIAGYTLIFDSYGMQLVAHQPFESAEKSIREGLEIDSKDVHRKKTQNRLLVKDTDTGKILQYQINDLENLVKAYRLGIIKQDRKLN